MLSPPSTRPSGSRGRRSSAFARRAPAAPWSRPLRAGDGGAYGRVMPPVSRGFHRRGPVEADPSRIPPGQYLTEDFPGLSAGPTPRTSLDEWSLTIDGAVDRARRWTWDEFLALPSETFTVDIHCVTKWSKFDTSWTGVAVDTLLGGVDTAAGYVTAWSDGGYTTNLPLADLHGRAWVVHEYGG